MPRLARAALLAALLGTALSAGAGAAPRREFYFLTASGRSAVLAYVALNGVPIVRAAPARSLVPVPVTRALRPGVNVLEAEYTGDPREGLVLVIERRRPGAPGREEVARLATAPGEADGPRVARQVAFSLALSPAPPPPALTEADREAIRGLIRAHHAALARRDHAALVQVYTAAVEAAREVYPEGVERHQQVMDVSARLMLAHPAFQMRPLTLDGLRFSVEGEAVVVDRRGGGPVFESDPVEVSGDAGPRPAGVTLAPHRLYFRRAGERWHSTLPALMP